MAYDYLGLVNDVNRRLNEVELTSSNFGSAIGEYAMVKDAVNASIRYINQHEYGFPFNHDTETKTQPSRRATTQTVDDVVDRAVGAFQ